MNTVNLMGRLVRTPETRYPVNEGDVAVTHYTLAVNHRAGGKDSVAFVRCVCFGKLAEFAESYFYKGIKVVVTGRISTGSYTNKDGIKVYTTDVIVERQEFAEKKSQDSNIPQQLAFEIGRAHV